MGLDLAGIRGLTVCEKEFIVEYKGKQLGKHRVDLIVESKVLVELKAVEGNLLNVHKAQTISEKQVSKMPVALLVNFGDTSVHIRRFESKNPLIP
jgi:GxxExxY protein